MRHAKWRVSRHTQKRTCAKTLLPARLTTDVCALWTAGAAEAVKQLERESGCSRALVFHALVVNNGDRSQALQYLLQSYMPGCAGSEAVRAGSSRERAVAQSRFGRTMTTRLSNSQVLPRSAAVWRRASARRRASAADAS
jgi:hypothetical protein